RPRLATSLRSMRSKDFSASSARKASMIFSRGDPLRDPDRVAAGRNLRLRAMTQLLTVIAPTLAAALNLGPQAGRSKAQPVNFNRPDHDRAWSPPSPPGSGAVQDP